MLHSERRARRLFESTVEALLGAASLFSILITLAIVGTLFWEAWPFFRDVGLSRLFTDAAWMPLFEPASYGLLSLACGTFVTTLVALAVAVPIGLWIALYLSQYAPPRLREAMKPAVELLSAVPTVVYGYFALLVVTPLLQRLWPGIPGFNMLSAGLVMGFMILPYVTSLSEDAMAAVPQALREGSMAMGATRLETSLKVVMPAALSGVISALVLAFSRAVGETMIVAIAAGMQPARTLNPLAAAQTLTAYIVQVSQGDLPHGTTAYRTIFVVGLALMGVTLVFNIAGHRLRRRFQEML